MGWKWVVNDESETKIGCDVAHLSMAAIPERSSFTTITT
jgi:hypothetical protein